jgi:Spy/CpxP family protein refolding chaperone
VAGECAIVLVSHYRADDRDLARADGRSPSDSRQRASGHDARARRVRARQNDFYTFEQRNLIMRRSILALALVLVTANLAAQGPPPMGGPPPGMRPGSGPGPDDWSRNFFPPELVMQHQTEIGLQDSQRAALTSAIQAAQGKFMDMQWKLSAEGEKMGRLLQGTQVDEAAVLDEVDRILNMEREIKKAQISLMVRIKNTLTAEQQKKLADIRSRMG